MVVQARALKSEKSSGECFRRLLQLAVLDSAVAMNRDLGLKEFQPGLPAPGCSCFPMLQCLGVCTGELSLLLKQHSWKGGREREVSASVSLFRGLALPCSSKHLCGDARQPSTCCLAGRSTGLSGAPAPE